MAVRPSRAPRARPEVLFALCLSVEFAADVERFSLKGINHGQHRLAAYGAWKVIPARGPNRLLRLARPEDR